MSITHIVTNSMFALVFASSAANNTFAAGIDTSLKADLYKISQRRILFGHQSVGANLLDGVMQLAKRSGVSIRINEVKTASGVKPATLGHAFVAKNGFPLQKLKNFNQAMGQTPSGLDIAFVKFCYVDISSKTDVKTLFSNYRATIKDLQARNPATTFIHVTAPLTIVQGGFKGKLKRLLGRAPYGVIENIRREEYNTYLRKAYQNSEPIFDLARIESTAPDGTAVSTEWQNLIVPAMSPIYTDDGEHLNTVGKLLAARELISILASIDQHVSDDPSH